MKSVISSRSKFFNYPSLPFSLVCTICAIHGHIFHKLSKLLFYLPTPLPVPDSNGSFKSLLTCLIYHLRRVKNKANNMEAAVYWFFFFTFLPAVLPSYHNFTSIITVKYFFPSKCPSLNILPFFFTFLSCLLIIISLVVTVKYFFLSEYPYSDVLLIFFTFLATVLPPYHNFTPIITIKYIFLSEHPSLNTSLILTLIPAV